MPSYRLAPFGLCGIGSDCDGSEHVVQRRRIAERTAASVDVRHELGAELVDVARDRDRRRLAERAQALAVDPVAHVQQQVELGLLRLAGLEPAQDLRHPARPFAARRALAARLVLVELRDADAELHHAAAVVERDDARRAHRRVQLQQRVEVVADVDLVALQDHRGRAAGNHGLELAAVRECRRRGRRSARAGSCRSRSRSSRAARRDRRSRPRACHASPRRRASRTPRRPSR